MFMEKSIDVWDENFGVVKSQLLLMDLLLPMNNISSMVLRYKRHNNFSPFDKSQALINDVWFKKPNTSTSKVCTYYGRSGYAIEICYMKHYFHLILVKNQWTIIQFLMMMMMTIHFLFIIIMRKMILLQSLKKNLTSLWIFFRIILLAN